MVLATVILIKASVTAVDLAVRVHHTWVLAVRGALCPAIALSVLLGMWQGWVVCGRKGCRLGLEHGVICG